MKSGKIRRNAKNNMDYEAEYKKCAKDFVYFCENYVKITHPSLGMIPFKLYGYQKKVAECYDKYKYNIIKKFRQGGLSTETVIYVGWRAMFHKSENTTLFVSRSDREAKQTGRIIDKMVAGLPEWLKPSTNLPNAHEKIFYDSDGAVYFYTVKAGRSRSVSHLVVDEVAFIQNMDEDWADLFPIISAGNGKAILISTPKGMDNFYANMYHQALKGENNFNVIDLDVSEHPSYCNPKWLKEQREQLGEKRFGQEVLGRFLAPGDTWLNLKLISDLDVQTRTNYPAFKRFPQWDNSKDENKGALWVWEKPIEGKDYIISVDSGEGQGSDYSAAQVITTSDSKQVAEFYSNTIPPFEFAGLLNELAKAYNQALLVVEKKGAGVATLEQLEKKLFYPSLYGEKRGHSKFRFGFDTNVSKRTAMLDVLQASLLNKTVHINSSRLIKEFNTFIFNQSKKRPEAGGKSNHDDLIIALAIAIVVRNEQYPSMHNYEQTTPIQANIFEQSAREIIRQELEDMYLTNEDNLNLPYIYDSPFGDLERPIINSTGDIKSSDEGRRAFLERPSHDILKEFGF